MLYFRNELFASTVEFFVALGERVSLVFFDVTMHLESITKVRRGTSQIWSFMVYIYDHLWSIYALTYVILSKWIICFDGHQIDQKSMMSRTKSPLLPKSGDFVRDILKKKPNEVYAWAVIFSGWLLRMSRTKQPLLPKSGHFVRDILQKSMKKTTKIGLGAPKIGLGALQSPPGGVQEASWRAKLVKNRKYTQKLDGIGSILVAKTEPKTVKNQPQKLYNFQYLLESIFSWILLPKWRPKTPWRTSFFGGHSFIDFWRMSLTKHQLLRSARSPNPIPTGTKSR